MHATTAELSATTVRRVGRWRVVDIVVASVVAVAAGVVFWIWTEAANPLSGPVAAALPGLQGLLNGPWLFAGVLGGLIVRKPGAAVYVELVGSVVEALIGDQYGWTTLLSGITQGLGVELVLAIALYRRWGWIAALVAGAGAGVGESVTDLLVWYPGAKAAFAVVYSASTIVSGAVIAGLGSWWLLKAIARTGALNRFAAGRDSGRV